MDRCSPRSWKWVNKPLMLGTVVREQVDEASDLRRQMMAVRIDRVHRKFRFPVFGKDADKPARLQIVGDQKSRRQPNTDTLQGGRSQCFATVGDQVAGDSNGYGGVVPVDEAPLIPVGMKCMAQAIAIRKFGQLPQRPVLLRDSRASSTARAARSPACGRSNWNRAAALAGSPGRSLHRSYRRFARPSSDQPRRPDIA